jgi:hypothetical protein
MPKSLANALLPPPCKIVPYGTPQGTSLVTTILDASASSPATILPKIDLWSVVFIVLLAALATSFAICYLRDKENIEGLREVITQQRDALAALSKKLDKLEKVQQKQDHHTQTQNEQKQDRHTQTQDERPESEYADPASVHPGSESATTESSTGTGEPVHTASESESECSDPGEQLSVSSPPSEAAQPPEDQPKVKPFKYLTAAEFTALTHKQRRKYNSYRRAHEEEVRRSQPQAPDSSSKGSDVPDASMNPFVKDFIPGGTRTDYKITENGLIKPKVPKDIRQSGPPWSNGRHLNTNTSPSQNGLLQSRWAS